MKRTLKSTAAIIALLMAISGCNDSGKIDCENVTSQGEKENIEDSVERITVSEVKDTFDMEIQKLKSTKFDNISFENLNTYSFPDIEKITEYKLLNNEYDGLPMEEFFDNFCKYCEYIAPGKFTRDEIAEKAHVLGDFAPTQDDSYNYNRCKELNDSNLRISYMALETPDFYLAYFGRSAPFWYQSNAAKVLQGADNKKSPVLYDILQSFD